MRRVVEVISVALAVTVAACNTATAPLTDDGSPFAPPGLAGPGEGSVGGGADGLCVLPLPDGGCPDTPVGPPLPADS